MKPVILFVLLTAACCSVNTENTNNTSAEGKAIEDLLAQYYRDMSDRNWQKYRSYFWQNATITTVWQAPGQTSAEVDVTTIDDFIKEAPNGPGSQPVFEERMTSAEIRTQGNIAEAWVDYEAKFGKPDSLKHWKGKDVFTFLRHDGEWKIVSLVFEPEV